MGVGCTYIPSGVLDQTCDKPRNILSFVQALSRGEGINLNFESNHSEDLLHACATPSVMIFSPLLSVKKLGSLKAEQCYAGSKHRIERLLQSSNLLVSTSAIAGRLLFETTYRYNFSCGADWQINSKMYQIVVVV